MKYIINTDDLYGGDIYKSMLLIGANGRGEVIVQKFNLDELEKLNFDYINEHYGNLDEAYQRGVEDGRNETWEAAKKISLMPPDEIEKVFPGAAKYNRYNLGYSGVEVIAKLKAYEEQKTADKIEAGDEVSAEDGTSIFIVTWMSERCICGVDKEGKCYSYEPKEICGKTGRHFDIILEEMKE